MTNDEIARRATGWLMNPIEIKNYSESPTPEADAHIARADSMRATVEHLLNEKDIEITRLTNELEAAKQRHYHRANLYDSRCRVCHVLVTEENKSEWCGSDKIIDDLRAKLEAVEKEYATQDHEMLCLKVAYEKLEKERDIAERINQKKIAENSVLREEVAQLQDSELELQREVDKLTTQAAESLLHDTPKPVHDKLKADLTAAREEIEELTNEQHLFKNRQLQDAKTIATSELSRGRLMGALEKIGGMRCKDDGDAFTIGGIVTNAISSEPPSAHYEAMKKMGEALDYLWNQCHVGIQPKGESCHMCSICEDKVEEALTLYNSVIGENK